MKIYPILGAAAVALTLAACQTSSEPRIIASSKGPVELRAMQSRSFDTGDRLMVIRAVVGTFQDLGYTVEKIEPEAGTVSAVKMAALRMSATVQPHGERQVTVRANAMVNGPKDQTQVDEPAFYQQMFFEPLARSLFLTAQPAVD